jgi:DMSO/TMAO reductase YedYZ molybdopterin-dependent catalytic subunit
VNDPSERRVAEEYMRREGRLPPGQSLTNGFPVGQYGPIPAFDPLTWDFRLFGELEEERHWNWPAFNALPRTQIRLDIHCVTRWSKFDTLWEGVSPRQMLDLGIIKLKPSARFVVQHCEGGFTTNLPLEVVLEFTPDDQPGFWERGGYHNDGDVWLEQRHAIRPRAE